MSWTGTNRGGCGSRSAGRHGLFGYIPGPAQNGHTGSTSGAPLPRPTEDLAIDRSSNRVAQDESSQQHKKRPSPSISRLENKASGFARRLFIASSNMGGHPDDLLNEIPEHAQAIADLNSNSPSRPPFRDLPSSLISKLANPTSDSEHPDWRTILVRHVSSPKAIQPLSNLQDLYIWAVRVGIPNAIIDNRRFMLHFYMHNSDAPKVFRLCYDDQRPSSEYIPLDREPQAHPPNAVPVHSIFQQYETPRGERFVQWLANPIHVPVPDTAPWQLGHKVSQLDGFLSEKEDEIRQVEGNALLSRTEGVLEMLWWLWMRNRELAKRQDAGWKGMERFEG